MYCFCTTYGGMRPGMPSGRKHFRRSRDAPIVEQLLIATETFGLLSKSLLYVSQT